MRKLTEKEIFMLEDQGCMAEEWSLIEVREDFKPNTIFNVRFFGKVSIGSLNGRIEIEEGFEMKCGLRNATLRDVEIGDYCLIDNVGGYISNYEIKDSVLISNVGVITTHGCPNYGNGNSVALLNEAGDGNVVIHDKLTAQTAQLMMDHPSVYAMVQQEQKQRIMPERGIIGSGTRIVGTKEIYNVLIGDTCEITGASKLEECTILSSDAAPTVIGHDVIMENSIASYGANIGNGAKIDNSFVGESVHVGKGYSSESTVMFSNTYLDNGESCSAFLGPFSCSHHKGSLLIAGKFSFYNAGSSTNQSNHAYKMGPIHYGTLDRGSKTASGAHIIWPAHFGPFTMVMGKVESHPDLSCLPFSYVIGKENKTIVVPGINIRTVGTWRDVNKWPKRDLRPKSERHDLINFQFPNPYIIQQVVKGRKLLEKLLEQSSGETLEYNGCSIKRTSAIRGIEYYDMAIGLFAFEVMKRTYDESEGSETGTGEWMDLAGMVVPKKEIERLVEDIEKGSVSTTSELLLILSQINDDYLDNESAYARSIMQAEDNSMFVDTDKWLERAERARKLWMRLIKDDAEKEFQMGDVDEEFFREFIDKIG